MRKHINLTLPPADCARLEWAWKQLKATNFAAFTQRVLLEKVRQLESEQLGSPTEATDLWLLSFIYNGCRTVEDIKYSCQSLSPVEIEARLFALTGAGYLDAEDGKRGRSWMWTITSKGLDRLASKGLVQRDERGAILSVMPLRKKRYTVRQRQKLARKGVTAIG